MTLARLRLHFLLNGGGETLGRLGGAVRDWRAALSRHPDAYGEVNVVESFKPAAIEGRVHAETVVDGTRLGQDGLNLLVLMLDEINRDGCVVPYLVCGDLPPPPRE